MAISHDEARILAEEDPSALFAAQVMGEDIGEPDECGTRPVTCRIDVVRLAYIDIFAKRRRSSRSRMVAELVDLGFEAVLRNFSDDFRKEIDDEATELIRAEFGIEKEGE